MAIRAGAGASGLAEKERLITKRPCQRGAFACCQIRQINEAVFEK
jgi:hypothetical protein